ncbi:MAG: lactate utilization protein [Clostridia bacterium]|nr:lactate utilization protein [Clostridia bacterium]
MDVNKQKAYELKMQTTAEALEKNNFSAYCVKTKEEAVEKLISLMNKGDKVGVGGSATLNELGIINLLRGGDYDFVDRYEEGLTREQMVEKLRESLLTDVFITSTNAVTEKGELYNVDGNANRVAAMLFGPKSVIVIAGCNKIVRDLAEAEQRVKTIAAPANCVRLGRNTPCTKVGTCMDCRSEDRICADRVIMSRQVQKGRVKVILVAEELGY